MMTSPLKISVIIPTMNRPADLKMALDSLARQTIKPYEIIIVDQSTNNESKQAVLEADKAMPVRFKYLVQEEKSLVKARNRGLDAAGGEVVSFLDDDVVLFDDYYEKVDAYFKANPEVGALSGNTVVKKLSGLKWFLRKMILRFFLLSFFDGRMTPSGFGYPIYEKQISKTISVDFLPGCNMNFRRDFIQDERFDEWFTGYSFREDADFSYRVAQNAKTVMIPEAKLYHHYSTGNRLDSVALKKMEIRNYYHLFKKYKNQGLFSKLLFIYSLAGLVLVDFIEFISSGKMAKLHKFRASAESAVSVIMNSEPRVRV